MDTETGISTKKRKRIKRRGKKQPQQPTNDLGGLLMSYIVSKANESMKQKSKKKPVEPNTPRSEAEFMSMEVARRCIGGFSSTIG